MSAAESKAYGKSIRIEDDVIELLWDEQVRLRKAEGKKPTYSEILRRMWTVYAHGNTKKAARKEPTTK